MFTCTGQRHPYGITLDFAREDCEKRDQSERTNKIKHNRRWGRGGKTEGTLKWSMISIGATHCKTFSWLALFSLSLSNFPSPLPISLSLAARRCFVLLLWSFNATQSSREYLERIWEGWSGGLNTAGFASDSEIWESKLIRVLCAAWAVSSGLWPNLARFTTPLTLCSSGANESAEEKRPE